IERGNKVVNEMGTKTKPRVYKLLAYAYFDNGDYTNALKNVNNYFAKEKEEDKISADYKLKADIIAKTGGTPDEIYNTYIQGAALDTVLTSKIDFLKKGADFFKGIGDSVSYNKEGDVRTQIISLKANPSLNEYYDAGYAYYKGNNFPKAISEFELLTRKFPDLIYGYERLYQIGRIMDSTMEKGLAVPHAIKYLEILEKDTTKNRREIISTSSYLAIYNANITKDYEKAIEYLNKMLVFDPTNADIQKNIDILKKAQTPSTKPKVGTTPKTSAIKKPVKKTNTTKSKTTSKSSVAKAQ
ncbi:MAG: tetratricopeptide repeat protein, partial [Chitinophagaceae bacterium]